MSSPFVSGTYTTSSVEAVALTGYGNDTYGLEIWFKSPHQLLPGVHRDVLELHACVDEACKQPIAGSPQVIELYYTVQPQTVGSLEVNSFTANVLSIGANDIAWDDLAKRMYVTTSSRSPIAPNSLLALDPATGTILSSQHVGSEPATLALSDDGALLYAALQGANEVVRFALPGLTPDLSVRLPPSDVYGPLKAMDLAVAPGTPRTIAVRQGPVGKGRQAARVTIFDDGVPRPLTLGAEQWLTFGSIAWSGDPATLYASEDSQLVAIPVDSSGIAGYAPLAELDTGSRIQYVDGKVYTDTGAVIDPGDGASARPFQGGRTVVDARLNRVFVLHQGQLLSYDKTTQALIASIRLRWLRGNPGRLIRWGSDGLAFTSDANQLVLVRGAFVDGNAPDTMLFLSQQLITVSAAAADAAAPTATFDLFATFPIPGGVHFEHEHTENGIAGISVTDGPQQHTARLTISFKAPGTLRPGRHQDTVEVRACRDPACAQPIAGSPKTVTVVYDVAPGYAVTSAGVTAHALVLEPQSQQILLSVPDTSAANPNSISRLDPASGALTLVRAGGEPSTLAVSPDARFLYAGMDASSTVERFQLPALASDLSIPLATEQGDAQHAIQIAVAPDAPTTLAVLMGDIGSTTYPRALAVFDEATPRSNRVAVGSFPDTVKTIAWGVDGSRLYGADARLTVLGADARGLSVVRRYPKENAGAGPYKWMQYVNGRLYAANGRVYDPETGDVLGTFPGAGPFVIDQEQNRAFVFASGSELGFSDSNLFVESYDLDTFVPLARARLPFSAFGHGRIIRWGADGLAVAPLSQAVHLISGDFVREQPPPP